MRIGPSLSVCNVPPAGRRRAIHGDRPGATAELRRWPNTGPKVARLRRGGAPVGVPPGFLEEVTAKAQVFLDAAGSLFRMAVRLVRLLKAVGVSPIWPTAREAACPGSTPASLRHR